MKKSNLIEILLTFSKSELRELRKWLASPAHNQREDVQVLFDYLLKNEHLTDEKKLEKATVFPQVFGEVTYDDDKMRQAMFFLSKATEEFLMWQEMNKDEVRRQIALSANLRHRKLDKLFLKTLAKANETQLRQPHRNENFLRNEYYLQRERYAFLSTQQRTVPLNLQEMSDWLDTTFVADKLRQICLVLSHQSVYKKEYDILFLQEVLENITKKNLLEIPAIAIYYYSYKAITEREDESYFQQLKQHLATHGDVFPQSEIRDVYLLAINYGIARMNAGVAHFGREVFDLYRTGFEKGFLVENNRVSRWTFRNVVTAALRLQEFGWVSDFIEKNSRFLEERHRESTVHFSVGRLNFEQKNYVAAMRLFSQVEYDDFLMNITAKTMMFKMLYEQEEYEVGEAQLESMRIYLQRKEVTGQHYTNAKNIIRYSKKLLRAVVFNKAQRAKLRAEIELCHPLTERDWLLRQLR